MSTLYTLNEQACRIYLIRVREGPNAPLLTDFVSKFKVTLEQLPSDCPGFHTLLWPSFIIALESSTEEGRRFFTSTLLKQYSRTGFNNVFEALKCLRMFWTEQTDRDWVQLLTRIDVFVLLTQRCVL